MTAAPTPHNHQEDTRDPDELRLECGVFGVFGAADASVLVTLGLHALQHRGQEACGIASFDGHFHNERRHGLVGDNFTNADLAKHLPGTAAIGHTRYSTAGGAGVRNLQPMFADLSCGGFAVAHNGNLTNYMTLRKQLVEDGAIFQSTSDSEVILQLVARSREARVVDRFVDALKQIIGGYALVAMTNKKLIGARDPLGIRPLVMGELEGATIFASESCALDIIGAKFIRDLEPGEVVVVDTEGVRSLKPFPDARLRPCIFEYVYFARPDSIVNGKSVYEARKQMGHQLAREFPADVDVIVPVPDSGVPAALGYAQEAQIPYELGIIRNHYVGRTFIQPTQNVRQLGVRLKHSANRSVLAGKRVVLVDDSVVRGTTSVKIVRMVREAGAKEVHLRIACPPITHPDFYGIDMPDREKLLAATQSLEEMTKTLEVDSLGFLSVEGLYHALGSGPRNAEAPQYTDHYFTGDYPTALPDQELLGIDKTHISYLVDA